MNPKPLAACCLAEAIGTFMLVLFGCGSVHNAVLLGGLTGLWQVAIVWGVVIMLAIYLVGSVSGAHINPAITIGFASWGLFPKGRVLPYVGSQFVGAFLAAALLYMVFQPYIVQKEKELGVTRGEPGSVVTASCYGEYFPNPGGFSYAENSPEEVIESNNKLVSYQTAFSLELLGTAILAMVVLAVTEEKSSGTPKFLAPVFIGLTISILICLIAPFTQAGFNPARDFGPRLFAYFAGWGEVALPGLRAQGWWLVYIVAPIAGSTIGSGIYLKLIRPWAIDADE